MKNIHSPFPIGVAITAALLLSSCGKQEAVGDVPSSEELAKQADAASKAIRDEEAAAGAAGADTPVIDSAAMTSYANALRGFSIMVPKDWTTDEEASGDNGRAFNDAKSNATLTAGWVENREDADLLAAVSELEDAGDGMTGNYINEDEYRASGFLDEDTKTAQRIMRKADGTMIRAAITYPASSAKEIDPFAKQILDSLTLL